MFTFVEKTQTSGSSGIILYIPGVLSLGGHMIMCAGCYLEKYIRGRRW